MLPSVSPYGRLEFVLTGAIGADQISQTLPPNCVIYKVWVAVRTAASGASSPTLDVGTTVADPDEIVDNQTPTVTVGTTAPTMVANYGPYAEAKTIICDTAGTWSTNSDFEASVICDYFRVPSLD